MSPTVGLSRNVVGFLEGTEDEQGRRIEGSDFLEGVTVNCRARARAELSDAESRESLTSCFREALLNRTKPWTSGY